MKDKKYIMFADYETWKVDVRENKLKNPTSSYFLTDLIQKHFKRQDPLEKGNFKTFFDKLNQALKNVNLKGVRAQLIEAIDMDPIFRARLLIRWVKLRPTRTSSEFLFGDECEGKIIKEKQNGRQDLVQYGINRFRLRRKRRSTRNM